MIREITVQNFKSLEDLHLPLGRVTVLIGENGAGKSNILEAAAFLGAAIEAKLDPEFLHSRGVRNCPVRNLVSGFNGKSATLDWRASGFMVSATPTGKGHPLVFTIGVNKDEIASDGPLAAVAGLVPDGHVPLFVNVDTELKSYLTKIARGKLQPQSEVSDFHKKIVTTLANSELATGNMRLRAKRSSITPPFVIYSPENTALRTFETEGQMRPLGVRGEGLFKLVQRFAEESPERFKALRKELKLFDWFSDFNSP